MSFENYPVIQTEITGVNRGKTSKWFEATELDYLQTRAEPGDILEINYSNFKLWAVYIGRCKFPSGQEIKTGVVHFDLKDPKEAPQKMDAVLFFLELVDRVQGGRVRVYNARDRNVWLDPVTNAELLTKRMIQFASDHK